MIGFEQGTGGFLSQADELAGVAQFQKTTEDAAGMPLLAVKRLHP